MNERTLNFAEAPVQVLTLEELERSYHENLPTGDPVGGIYHFALIQQLLEIFEKRGLKPVVQEIFAAANRSTFRYTRMGQLKKIVYPVWTPKGVEYLKKTLKVTQVSEVLSPFAVGR